MTIKKNYAKYDRFEESDEETREIPTRLCTFGKQTFIFEKFFTSSIKP
jgi:hypothetical protein